MFCKYKVNGKCTKEMHYRFGQECNTFYSSICEHKENPYVENILTQEKLNEINKYRESRWRA